MPTTRSPRPPATAARATKTAPPARAATTAKAVKAPETAKAVKTPVPPKATKAPAASKVEKVEKTEKALKAPKPPKAPKEAKPARQRVKPVRDSFTMPQADFALIGTLKAAALAQGRVAKKSELLRAGLQALAALDATALVAALDRLEPVKVGRPGKGR